MLSLRVLVPAAVLASLVLLTATDAPAGCTTGGIGAMPPPGTALAVNGHLIIEGSGNMAPMVAALSSEGLVLASDTEEVPLHVEAVHMGSWHVAQAVLAPVRPLEPGKRHVLRATGALQGSPLDVELRRTGRLAWTTSASAPADDLHWTARPSRGAATIRRGCPSLAYVAIHVPLDHPERLLGVLAEVRPLVPGATTIRYVVPADKGEIALGFVGCEEPIGLAPGVMHLVKLTALDLAGREIPAPGGAIAVVGPSEKR